MNKKIWIFALCVLVLGGVYWLTQNQKKPIEINSGIKDFKNVTFTISGQPVQLVNGVSEAPSAPGSATKVVTKYFGNEIHKDLNGDGKEDVAFLVTQSPGGSGTFFYVVGAIATENGYKGTSALLIGDRIAPQTTESGQNKIIIVNYADRKPGEPMTALPSVGKSLYLLLDPKTDQFGEVVQNFEGEANPASMTLQMKTWQWQKTIYSNDKTVVPNVAGKFSITFKPNGEFTTTTDCNGIGGKYVATKNSISFSEVISTMMACQGSQESDFKKIIDGTQGYHFTSKGELVFDLKYDSGSAIFK